MSDFLHITISFFYTFLFLFLFIYFYFNFFFLLFKYDSQLKQNTSGCLKQIEMIITYVTNQLIKFAKYPR